MNTKDGKKSAMATDEPPIDPRFDSAQDNVLQLGVVPGSDEGKKSGDKFDPPKIPKHPKTMVGRGDFNKRARAKWREVCGSMLKVRTLSELDLDTIEVYCLKYIEWLDVREERDGKFTQQTSNNNTIQHPLLSIENKLHEYLQRLRQQLGMTPVTRRRTTETTPPGESPL